MKILEEFWYGNIEPTEYDTSSKEYKKLLRHGFGLGIGTEAEGWINDAVAFWERNSKRGGVN